MKSLRARVMLVATLVAIAPVVLILASVLVDHAAQAFLSDRVSDALARCSTVECLEHAHLRGVLLDEHGQVREERDGARPSFLGTERWFGVSLPALDRELPPWRTRAPCLISNDGALLACQACRGELCAQGASLRTIRSLYSHRYQALKLAAFVLLVGLAIGWLASTRMVRPIAALRDDLLRRAKTALPGSGVALDRRDEVGDLSRAFDALLAALHDRATTQLSLLADVVHEMKSPIAAIRSAEESLALAESTEQRARLRTIIGTSAEKLDALVSELLELGRAEAGLPGYKREPVHLGALVRGVAPESVRVEHDDSTVLADAPSLERALKNIVENAVSFAKSHVEVRVAGGTITVSDDGPGIAAADATRVFERFYTTRRTSGGTGLGLALSRAIVEAHGGRVEAKQSPLGGAEIVITFAVG